MKKITLPFFFCLIVLPNMTGIAQTSIYKFQKIFGRSGSDLLNGIKLLSDGGYLVAGSTQTLDTATMLTRQDMYVIKTDSAGNVKWSNIYGSTATEAAFSIEEGPNGYYIFGNSIDASSVSSADLLHTDTAGNVIWNKTYSMYTNEWGAVIKKVNANAYMLCGKTYNGANDFEIFLVKTDSSGNVIWGKGYNGDAGMTDVAHALTATSDGGFLITGDSYNMPSHNYYVMAVKTDSNGTAEWINTYADTRNSRGLGGYEVPGGGYVLGGQIVGTSTAADMLMIRTDNTGDVIWSKSYGGSSPEMVHAVVKLDTGYALIGESGSFFTTGITNAYVVKTDTGGNMISSFTYGDTNLYSAGTCAVATSHNGIAIGGITMGYGPSLENFYLVKTIGDSSGCFELSVNTTVSAVTISSSGFLNTDTLTTTVADVTATLDTGLNQLETASDSTHCFSETVIPGVPTEAVSQLVPEETRIYPNPNTGSFTIQTGQKTITAFPVKVFNVMGMDVTRSFEYTQSGDNVSFKALRTIPGNYWVRIAGNSGSVATYKVVIE